jgi:hypothetical protein
MILQPLLSTKDKMSYKYLMNSLKLKVHNLFIFNIFSIHIFKVYLYKISLYFLSIKLLT